jgi:tetratricopeptide (TPR) repeat protein
VQGTGYLAACLALAGRIDGARRAIDELSDTDRQRAAEIVFEIGHPVADAGDDRSAGPIMELVVDYIPSHFMALYHAGMAEYVLGQRDLSRRNLTEFLKYYPPADGWRHNAEEVLRRLNDPSSADPRRPREP